MAQELVKDEQLPELFTKTT